MHGRGTLQVLLPCLSFRGSTPIDLFLSLFFKNVFWLRESRSDGLIMIIAAHADLVKYVHCVVQKT